MRSSSSYGFSIDVARFYGAGTGNTGAWMDPLYAYMSLFKYCLNEAY